MKSTVYVLDSNRLRQPRLLRRQRLGNNRFANSLLALDASTGKLVWHQQLVHHDLWDFDVAAQPVLADIELQGIPVPAVIQATKTGMLYVFDRVKGQPLFPITEKPVPRQHGPRGASLEDPTVLIPAVSGVATPLNPDGCLGNHLLGSGQMPRPDRLPSQRGHFHATRHPRHHPLAELYRRSQLGRDRGRRIAPADLRRGQPSAHGRHADPAGRAWSNQIKSDDFPNSEFARQAGTPYAMRREPLLSPWGLPCTAPPWGTLVSVDLRRNRIVWQVPLGSTEGIGPWFAPTRNFGMPNMGGPIATAGDLVFVGAAMDSYFRAFDIETGRELWKYRLPAGGQATPMTYRAGRDQRQYVVIAAGGHGGLGTPRGDYVVAFALPRRDRPGN